MKFIQSRQEFKRILPRFALVAVVLFIGVMMSFLSPVFMTSKNMTNIFRQISINGIIAVGMTFVILLGDIDLSVGAVIGIVSVFCGKLLEQGMNWFTVCLIALCVAILFGIVNGTLVAYLDFQPFVATLATVTIGRGIALAYSDGRPYIISNPSFKAIGQGYVGKVPIPVIILLVVCALGYIILNYTTFGRYFFAVGGNKNAARLSGVKTKRVEMSAFIISAICASVVGMILSARISSGQPNSGTGYELDAIAAVAIGGTSMNGGVGSLSGTILGFILIGLLSNSMNLMNINSFYQQIVKGSLIIIAVYVDMKSKGNKK
ncbi:MAG: ABC transporter permease [Sphaerochaeta sp.]